MRRRFFGRDVQQLLSSVQLYLDSGRQLTLPKICDQLAEDLPWTRPDTNGTHLYVRVYCQPCETKC